MKCCDTATIITPSYAAQLAALGYEAVGRYYRRAIVSRHAVSPEEAATIFRAGLYLFVYFQGDKATEKPGYYNAANGAIDGAAAVAKGKQMMQPAGTVVYHAVDTDITGETIEGVVEYFEAVNLAYERGDAIFGVGCYGDDLVCRTLQEKGLATAAVLANATGWRTDKAFDTWNIKQGAQFTLPFGLQIDAGEARDAADAGMWRLQ